MISALIQGAIKLGVKACNISWSDDTSLSLCLLQVDDSILITVSILRNRKRCNALEPSRFASLMRYIEGTLAEVSNHYSDDSPRSQGWFMNVSDVLPPASMPSILHSLDCHRLFVVPLSAEWEVTGRFTDEGMSRMLSAIGIGSTSVIVATSSHSLSIRMHYPSRANAL